MKDATKDTPPPEPDLSFFEKEREARLKAEDALSGLQSILREYLALSSIDGRAERQILRSKLKAICGHITTS